MVLEYATERLVDEISGEVARGRPMLLVDQLLIRAQAKDYVRQTQEHLIGEPIVQRVQADYRPDADWTFLVFTFHQRCRWRAGAQRTALQALGAVDQLGVTNSP